MDLGRYLHRITIQSRVETVDAVGGITTAWVDAFPTATALGGIPAEVLTGPGRELRAAGGEQAEATARIAFQYLPGVDQSQRVLWDGQIFNIRSVEFDRSGRGEVRLICTAGVNDGR